MSFNFNRRNLNLVLFALLLILLLSTYLQEPEVQAPEQEFLALALACHREYRPALEAMLSKSYNIFQVTEGCNGDDERLSSEILADAVLVVRSRKHDYEIVFTPLVAGDGVRWSCESNVPISAAACDGSL